MSPLLKASLLPISSLFDYYNCFLTSKRKIQRFSPPEHKNSSHKDKDESELADIFYVIFKE